MEGIPFWNVTYPFKDFLVFSFEGEYIKENTIREVEKKCNENNLDLLPKRKYGNISSYIISNNVNNKFSKSLTLLSGIAQNEGEFKFGQSTVPTIGKIDDKLFESTGIFTIVHANDKFTKLSQDFFGCGTLFYLSYNNLFIVSNRYHLLLLVLSWLGFKGELNVDKVISNLYSDTTFLQQNISSQMDIKGVKQLPFDQEIEIDENGWRIVEKKPVKDALLRNFEGNYEEYLHKGTNEVISNIHSVLESGLFDKHITDLSGGMDSRAVFAAILNVKGAMLNTEIRTKDVPGSNDLKIAAGLKNLFNGTFLSEFNIPQYGVELAESLNIWRSYFMGLYHRLGLPAWSPRGETLSQIRFSGGASEIYRTFWYNIYKEKTIGSESVDDLVRNLTSTFPQNLTDSHDIKERLDNLLVDEISSLPGDSPNEKFDNHYLYFRNRYHFGMRAFEYYHDRPIWFPLMSKFIFYASRLQDFSERSNDKLILDLTERLHPLLIWIDYASKSGLVNKISITDHRFYNSNVILDTNTDEWQKKEIMNKERLQYAKPKMSAQFNMDWRDQYEHLHDKTLAAFYELRSYSSELNELLDDNYLNYINKSISNQKTLYQTYSKLNSLRDQIAIFN